MKEKTDFSIRLKIARELRGISQEELAIKIGLKAAAISHYESGRRKPSIDNLLKLAEALEVTTDYLLVRPDWMIGIKR